MPVCTMRTPHSSSATAPRNEMKSSVPPNATSSGSLTSAVVTVATWPNRQKLRVTKPSYAPEGLAVQRFLPLPAGLTSVRERGRYHRPDPDASIAGKLDGRMPPVESGNEAEQIDFESFNPADLDVGDPPQIKLDAGAAVCASGVETGAEITADRIRRQRHAQLGHGAQHRGGKRVAVRPRPDAVIVGMGEAVVLDGPLDLRDQLFGVLPAHVRDRDRLVAVPKPVRRPAISAHRIAPADHVVACPSGRARALQHNPAMDRKHAFPASGRARDDQHTCRLVIRRILQAAGTRPVGVLPAARRIAEGKESGARHDGQNK